MISIRLGLPTLGLALFVAMTNSEPFSISSRIIEIPESGEVTDTVLRTDKHEFTFLPPAQWKSIVDDKAGVITWTSGDYRSVLRLSITVSTNRSGQPTQNRPEELKHVVLQELPAAKFTEQFPCYTANGNAVGFDLEGLLDDKHSAAIRIVFLPFPGGYVQIKLTTATENFAERQFDLTRLLNSLHIDPVKSH